MASFSIFARSSLGRSIIAHHFGITGPKILLLGGVHGDEPEGIQLALLLLARFHNIREFCCQITMVPIFNLDGCFNRTRTNARGVDLNRNLPTKDWSPLAKSERYNPGPQPGSEVENQALVDWLNRNRPELIISLHSWMPMINVNGNPHPAAHILSQTTGYPLTRDMGYPTPGSLGTFANEELQIAMITYELEEKISVDQLRQIHAEAIIKSLGLEINSR